MSFYDRSQCEPLWQQDGLFVGEFQHSSELIEQQELCASFDGVNTMLDFVAREMPRPGSNFDDSVKYRSQSPSFYSFETYEEALDAYSDTPSKVRSFVEFDELLQDGDAAGMDVDWDVTGDFLNVARYLEGDPECFGSMTGGNPRGWHVNLYANVTWSGVVNKEILNARGQRLQRLIDWLEAQQVRTALTAVMSSGCAHIEVAVKRFDDALDINDIAVSMHGDFFRRLMFRFMEHSKTISFGYGKPTLLSGHLAKHAMVPDSSTEIAVVVDIGGWEVDKINSEFDDLERWLGELIGSDTSEAERTKIILPFKKPTTSSYFDEDMRRQMMRMLEQKTMRGGPIQGGPIQYEIEERFTKWR